MTGSAPNEREERRLWAALAGEGGGPTGPCPSLSDLAAYVDARLADAERVPIDHHLADCPECLAAVLDARATRAAEAKDTPPARVIESALSLMPEPVATPRFVPPRPATAWRTFSRWPVAVAASLLVGVLGYRAGLHSSADESVPLVTEMTFGLLAGQDVADWEAALLAIEIEGGS